MEVFRYEAASFLGLGSGHLYGHDVSDRLSEKVIAWITWIYEEEAQL